MSALVHLVVLACLFALMGFLTEPPGTQRLRWKRGLAFLAAAGIALLMTVIGMAILLLMLGIYTLLSTWLSAEVGVFLGIILVMVGAGVVLFLVMRPILQRFGATHEWLTIVEYYIQWSLIYVTIYQVIVENLSGATGLMADLQFQRAVDRYLSTVLDPALLVVLLLPVLISVWITTALVKIRIEALTRGSSDVATLEGPPVADPAEDPEDGPSGGPAVAPAP